MDRLLPPWQRLPSGPSGLRDLINRASNRQAREHALGELRYVYARNDAEQLTMWLLAFKSIDMFWLTVGPLSSASVQPLLANIEWTRPAPSTNSMYPDSADHLGDPSDSHRQA
jgi:hypothetical protein